MKYSDKIKKSKKLYDLIKSLKDDDKIKLEFTFYPYGGREKKVLKLTLSAHLNYKDEIDYSLWDTIKGMNISKVTKTSLRGYTFDMMSQRTSYMFPLTDFKVIEIIRKK